MVWPGSTVSGGLHIMLFCDVTGVLYNIKKTITRNVFFY